MSVPFSEKLKFLTIEVGSVFEMQMGEADNITPHGNDTYRNKMFVVLGKDKECLTVASVIINSNINARKFNRIAPYQHQIYKADYNTFLKHDSFVDGYQVRVIDIGRLLQQETKYLGFLQEEDLKQIISKVRSSPAVKAFIIERYNIK